MPRIVRLGCLNLTDDVVRIKDLCPELKPLAGKKAAAPKSRENASASAENFEPAFDEIYDEAPDTEDEDAVNAREAERAPARTVMTAAVQSDIIAGAMAEASRIIEDALRKAEETRSGMLAGVQSEAEQIRARAAEEGRRQGAQSAMADVRGAADSLEQAVARFEGERAGFEAEYEEQLRWLSIEIASKVLAKKISEDDADMAEMVEKAVQSVRSEPWVRVEVSQEMVRLIERLQSLFEGQQGIEVSAIPAGRGTVHIETPSGLVDVSLHTQLANLKEYFAAGGG